MIHKLYVILRVCDEFHCFEEIALKLMLVCSCPVENAYKSCVDCVRTIEYLRFRRNSADLQTIRADHTGPAESQLQVVFS